MVNNLIEDDQSSVPSTTQSGVLRHWLTSQLIKLNINGKNPINLKKENSAKLLNN